MQSYIVRGTEVVGVGDENFTPPDESWLMVPIIGEVVGNLGELEYVDGLIRLKPVMTMFTGTFSAPVSPPLESVLEDAFPETELFLKAKVASETRLEVMSEFAVALYADITKNQALFNDSVVKLMRLLN